MNKDEILEKSRAENVNGDEMEKKGRMKASAISAAVGMLLCMIIVIIEELVFDRNATAIWVIYTGIQFTSNFLEYAATKKRMSLLLGIIFGICVLLNIVIYILECIGA